jgi:hypothetical protein
MLIAAKTLWVCSMWKLPWLKIDDLFAMLMFVMSLKTSLFPLEVNNLPLEMTIVVEVHTLVQNMYATLLHVLWICILKRLLLYAIHIRMYWTATFGCICEFVYVWNVCFCMHPSLECIQIPNTRFYSKIISSDAQKRREHVSTNLLLTTLHKICASEAKLNDRHLIGRPSVEKYRWKIHWKKDVTATLQFTAALLCTHITDALHLTGSSTFFSSDQHHD